MESGPVEPAPVEPAPRPAAAAPCAHPPPVTTVVAAIGAQTFLPYLMSTAIGATLDFNLDYTRFAEATPYYSQFTFIGIRAHGQYIAPKGYGGYLTLPGFHASANGYPNTNGVGNIEIGGLYVMRPRPTIDIMLRGGVALDTAGDLAGGSTPISHLVPRLGDAYPAGLSRTWARAQGSLRHTAGAIIVGGAVGLDVPYHRNVGEDDGGLGFGTLARLVASIGFTQGRVGAAVGIVLLRQVNGTSSDDSNIIGANANLDVSVARNTRMYGLFGIKFEGSLSGYTNDIADEAFSVGVGLRHAFH